MNRFNYIFANCFQGQRKKGVEVGSTYIKDLVFGKKINMKTSDFDSKLGYKKLSDYVYETHRSKKKPFIFGGDHSISIGSINGSLNYFNKDLTVIWIDTHADINTQQSSKSKNLHGMPLSYLTGLEKDFFSGENYKFPHNMYFPGSDISPPQNYDLITNENNKLSLDNLIYLGLRDIDDFEQNLIDSNNIQHLTSEELKFNTPLDKMEVKTNNIHLSIDIDVLDPKYFPCTGTPVKNGITMEKLEEIIWWSHIVGNVVSIDLVEFNPKIGNEKDLQVSLDNYKKLIGLIHKIFSFGPQ